MALPQKVSADLLRRIKESVNLIEIVGEHVVLKKSGANYSGLCPFHSERTPSFSVSEGKQLYHCYGCKKGGDIITFMMEIHGIDFPEAVEELADRAKVALPKSFSDATSDPERAKLKDAAREKMALAQKLNRFVAAFYRQSLAKTPHALEYFQKRGLAVDSDLGKSFYLGVAPPSWNGLSGHLLAKKAPLPVAVDLGLIRPSAKANEGGLGYFDSFRNRAIFPIIDMRGKVAGFGGRSLPVPSGIPDAGFEGPKYLNSSESILFQKSRLVYGLYQAQKHVREKDQVIVVEGYFDVLALHAAGFQNVVSTCGTALTPEHLTLLRKFADQIIILFDGDRAGITATERAMELGLDYGLVLKGAAIPHGLDPDEILFDQSTGLPKEGGVEKMREILAQASSILDTQIEAALLEATKDAETKTQTVKKIAQWLRRFNDPVGRQIRMESVVKRLGISVELLRQAMQASAGHRSEASKSGADQASKPSGPPRVAQAPKGSARPVGKMTQGQKVMLAAIVRGGDAAIPVREVRDKLPPGMTIAELFDYSSAREFVATLLGQAGVLERLKEVPETLVEGEKIDPLLRSMLTEILVKEEDPYPAEEVKAAVGQALGRSWARFSQQVKSALADAEAKKDAGLQSKLMKEYLDVQRKMKEFISFYDEA